MPETTTFRAIPVIAGAIAALVLAAGVQAQSLGSTVQAEKNINENSAKSQVRVSSLARQTQDLLTEYRSVVRETESLKIYNDKLERVVTDQRNEIE